MFNSQAGVVGWIRHVETGLVIHPEGGHGVKDSKLVLHNDLRDERLLWEFDFDGCLKHVGSGLHVHPLGGRAGPNVHLILHPGGREGRLRLHLQNGFLIHQETNLLVHPLGGKGYAGVQLIYHPGGIGELRLKFEFVPRNSTPMVVAPVIIAPPVVTAPPIVRAPPVAVTNTTTTVVQTATNPLAGLPPSANQRGWLKHVQSGLFVAPEGLNPSPNCALSLNQPSFYDPRYFFEWDQGCIKHSASNMFVWPAGGNAVIGAPLILFASPPEQKLQMSLRDTVFFHHLSNLTVHLAGPPALHTRLVFNADNSGWDKTSSFVFEVPSFH